MKRYARDFLSRERVVVSETQRKCQVSSASDAYLLAIDEVLKILDEEFDQSYE